MLPLILIITEGGGMCKNDAPSTIHYYIKIIFFIYSFSSKINLELKAQWQCTLKLNLVKESKETVEEFQETKMEVGYLFEAIHKSYEIPIVSYCNRAWNRRI